jgi:hypothetical protein
MEDSITFRLSAADRAKLRRKADECGQTESELLRKIVSDAVTDTARAEARARVRGAIKRRPSAQSDWAKQLRERNWRE